LTVVVINETQLGHDFCPDYTKLYSPKPWCAHVPIKELTQAMKMDISSMPNTSGCHIVRELLNGQHVCCEVMTKARDSAKFIEVMPE
jgi:superfamily II DNA helicase RecQ